MSKLLHLEKLGNAEASEINDILVLIHLDKSTQVLEQPQHLNEPRKTKNEKRTTKQMKTYKDLYLYQSAMDYVTEIYTLTQDFPKEEIFGLTSQMRRAAVSIPSNIAEGSSRKGTKEYIQFLYVALGSNSELNTQLTIAFNLNYISEEQHQHYLEKSDDIGKMINGVIRYLKKKN